MPGGLSPPPPALFMDFAKRPFALILRDEDP